MKGARRLIRVFLWSVGLSGLGGICLVWIKPHVGGEMEAAATGLVVLAVTAILCRDYAYRGSPPALLAFAAAGGLLLPPALMDVLFPQPQDVEPTNAALAIFPVFALIVSLLWIFARLGAWQRGVDERKWAAIEAAAASRAQAPPPAPRV